VFCKAVEGLVNCEWLVTPVLMFGAGYGFQNREAYETHQGDSGSG
jgi:hypothetical protein